MLRHRWSLAITALIVAAIAVLVVRGVMRPDAAQRPSRIKDAIDLAPPTPMTERERAAAGAGLDPDATVKLEAGAWVEVADPQSGRLAQRYSADQVDPLPDQWVRLTQPRASFHTDSGRVVTLSGDLATARVPRRALQSGTIKGSVVIRLFRPDAQGRVDLVRDTPALEIHTEEGLFDADIGQLHCEDEVEVFTPAARFRGRNLTLTLDAKGDAPERLVVERAVGPIVIDLNQLQQPRRAAPRPAAPAPPASVAAPVSEALAATGATAAPTPPTPGQPAATAPAGEAPAAQLAARGAAPGGGAAPAAPTARPSGGARAASAAPPPTDARAATDAALRFYRLTLHDDVKVVRRRGGVESTIDGSTLAIVFSLEGDAASSAISLSSTPCDEPVAGAATDLVTWIASLAVAAEAPLEDVLTITYSGRLIMVPDPDASRELTSPDDVRIEVAGAPVRFRDDEKALVGHCQMLRYDGRPERLELVGSADDPVEATTDRYLVTAERLWFSRNGGDGGMAGPGRLTIREPERASGLPRRGEPLRFAAAAFDEAMGLAIAAMIDAAADPSSSPASPASPASPPSPAPATPPPPAAAAGSAPLSRIPLEILWNDGVDLRFAPAEGDAENGALRQALFRGDVRVVGEDFAMRSNTLDVGFAGGGAEGEQSLSSIDAAGQVRVRRLGESANMDAERLVMALERVEGRSVPKTLRASGGVAARDANRTILSDSLDVGFKPKATVAAEAPPPAGGDANAPKRTPGSMGEQIGTVDIATVLAQRDVRVQLEDGARVYADRLDGDSIAGTLALAAAPGGEVMIVRDKVLADRLANVSFDDATRSATSSGPGRFRFFENPVPLPALESRERPQVAARPTLEATWTELMRFDDRGGAASQGEITLGGAVAVRSEPRPEELDTLTAKELKLGLAERPNAGGQPAAAPNAKAPGANAAVLPGGAESRDLVRVTATGSAQLEGMRWPDGARAGVPPQLFRVRGEQLDYDLRTREAMVSGAGQLLVHDVTPGREGAAPAAAGAVEGAVGGSTFGGKGSATFSWKGRMEMRRESGDRFLIVLTDEVEVLHLGLRAEDTLTLTASRLEITVDRPDPAPGAAVDGRAKADAAGGLDLGTAKIVRIRAIGAVFVRAPEADVDCHEFDYNAVTGIATMRARPGRQVQAILKGGFAPLRAESMRWDMTLGKIQIQGAAAEVGR